MEKIELPIYEYKVITAMHSEDFEPKLNTAGNIGFRVTHLIDVPQHFYMAIMEREVWASGRG